MSALLLCPLEDVLVSQIAPSACGATAILNAMSALGIRTTTEQVNSAVGTRTRNLHPDASLVEYLTSRHNAGATHEDLIRAVVTLSSQTGVHVSTRFVAFSDGRFDSENALLHFCEDWITQGAALIFTMNLQRLPPVDPACHIHDAWHHQMAFGVSVARRVVLLTNPVQEMTVDTLLHVLDSDSVLLVREQDVLARLQQQDLVTTAEALNAISPAWRNMRVGEALIAMCSADRDASAHRYLPIPAAYVTGALILFRGHRPDWEKES